MRGKWGEGQSLRYGAQTPFSDQLSSLWAGGLWQYDAQHDSIITAGNGGSKPTQAAFTILYNQGTQKYRLEQTLQPGDQMWMDIGKLIREHLPDKDGNTLPAGLTSGSYEIRDLTNKGIGTLFEGKVIYDKTYGHVTYGCAACCGWTDPITLWYDPISVIITGLQEDGVFAWYPCESETDDVSSVFNGHWSSSAPSIATVDYYGSHTGVAVGSTSSATYGLLQSNNSKNFCPALRKAPGGGVNVTKLSCTPSPVSRGSSITCTVQNAPTRATFSNWKFTDSNNNTVTSTQTGSSWSGAVVTSGTLSVDVSASGSNSTTVTAPITVNNRSGFAFSAVSAASEPNGFSTPQCSPPLSVQTPPQVGQDLGLFCLQQNYSFNFQAINDNGPNQGYKYITSITNSNGGTNTAYYYVVSPDAADPNSTFSKAQCGNYDPNTNTSGFISQANLIANIIRHESGSINSHYIQYVAAQNSTTNNLGTVAEQMVGLPSDSNFQTTMQNVLSSKMTTIGSSAQNPEPCGANYNGAVTPCVYQGAVNFIPYLSCN